MGLKKEEKTVMMGISKVKMAVIADVGSNKDITARFQEQDAYKQQSVEILSKIFQQSNAMMEILKMEMGAVQSVQLNQDFSAE